MTRSAVASQTRVYSYVVAVDSGFSPNPFHGWCTLACCKPMIRRRAQPGDLVIGLTDRCERVVYAMRVAETMTFADYWRDRRFRSRRPRMDSQRAIDRRGDNIYEPDGLDGFRQLPSQHWDRMGQREDPRTKRHDIGGRSVLATRDYVYFGGDGPPVPERLSFLRVQRGHRCRFSPAQVQAVLDWYDGLERGIRGPPAHWADDDTTWVPRCG